jgi:hypothetical protein
MLCLAKKRMAFATRKPARTRVRSNVSPMEAPDLIPFGRTVKIVDKGLKGKAEIPTLTLKGQNGEKWVVPINSGVNIEDYLLGQEIRVRFEDIPHRDFDLEPAQETKTELAVAVESSLPIKVTEASASIPDDVCPQGVYPKEYGHSEFCDNCEHLQRIGDDELGMGSVACDLDPKPKEELAEENTIKEAL